MAVALKDIDSWMRHIWLKVVKEEYERSRILEESNLHSTGCKEFGVRLDY